MAHELADYRIVTASAYAGMMAPLTGLPSTVCVLTGDTDNDGPGPVDGRFSLESLDGTRRRWRLGDLSRLADFVPKVLSTTQSDTRPALVVPPRASTFWEESAATWPDDVRLLGRPAHEVARIADDKIFVREQLRRLGAPVPASLVLATADLDHHRIGRELGLPYVLQNPRGAGGQGTHLIETESQLDAVRRDPASTDRWLVSRFAGTVTINVAGVVYADGVAIMPASVQASGIAELGAGYGAYCGSDFGAVTALPARALDDAYAWTARVGQWLHETGHLGIFGADIAVDGDDIAFLEINPRIQGSSWLLSQAQLDTGAAPCLVEHVRAVLGLPAPPNAPPPSTAAQGTAPPSAAARGTAARGTAPAPVLGSHLLVRWTGACGVVDAVPRAGSYPLPDAPALVSGLPAAGSIIAPGAIAARISARASLATAAGGALLPEAAALLETLRAGFHTNQGRMPATF